MMLKLGVLALFTAKPGKEAEVTDLLDIARGFAAEEDQTLVWYAFQNDSSPFGIFDAFADDAGRQAHLNGRIPALFAQVGPDLLAAEPDVRPTDIFAVDLG
ncbi:putative quinol monooxygenase [Kitasatospora sp. NPDC058397]|uniref:putative quinol monooxygenase n=1 Tax=unclassified Kitasatospora TaxID=2633591 RepID=UPI00365890DB